MPSGRKRCLSSYVDVTGAAASVRLRGSRIVHPSHSLGHQEDSPPSQEEPAQQPYVCRICHFPALDSTGLLQHLSVSPYCSRMSEPLIPPTLPEHVAGLPPSIDFHNDDAIIDDNDNIFPDEDAIAADEDASSLEGDNEFPEGIPRACAISHSICADRCNTSDDEDEDEVDDDDDDDDEEEDDSIEEQVVLTNHAKYEYYDDDQKESLTSPDDTVHVHLADLCRRIRAPLYAYDEILQWSQEAHLSGYRFSPNAPTYRSMISSLKSRLCLGHLTHRTATIRMCGGGTLDFPTFEFDSMFYDLIDDHRISPHLLINFDCPKKPPSFNSQLLDEVHTGKWHRLTSRQLLKEDNDVLCGIIFFFDRTHVSNKEKLSIHPLMFSLSIIPRWLRNQPFAWRPLGYYPKLPPAKKIGHNIDTLHRCLDEMLSGLAKAQLAGGLKAPVLANDGRQFRLCFKVPICYVIGDVEGHNEICTRYGSHKTYSLSRECDCTTNSSDDPDVMCTYLKASTLTELRRTNDTQTLQSMAFHNVTNAFDKLCFGANEHGIHRATPSEVLHSLQKGWYLYALEGFYSQMGGPSILDFLESVVQRVSADCRHQSDRNMPRLRFANGIQSYANLQAHETTGVLLLIVISLHCKIGWDKHSTDSATVNSFARSRFCKVRKVLDYRDLFETLLCMEQWIKLPSVRKADVTPTGAGRNSESPAKSALRIAIKKFVKTVDRSKGLGMKLTKVHSVLHVPDDVALFGSGKNWDSGPSESNHKENVKRKAALTNLCKDTLEDQVATRFEESLVIEHAKGILLGNVAADVDNSPASRQPNSTGSRIKLTISCSTEGVDHFYDSINAAWNGKKKSKFCPDCTYALPPQAALGHLLQLFRDAYDKCPQEERPTSTSPLCVNCFTEHKTSITDAGELPHIFRAHPAYRGGLPWNDWVYVEYCFITLDARGRITTSVFENHLSKIILFLDLSHSFLPNMTDIEGYVRPGMYALVQTLDKQPEEVPTSVFLSTCTLSDKFYLVRTFSFGKPAFVVENVGCEKRSLFVVPPMDEWAGSFL